MVLNGNSASLKMNNLENFLRAAGDLNQNNPLASSARAQTWTQLFLPAAKILEGENPSRVGAVLQASFFNYEDGLKSVVHVSLGRPSLKNFAFASEKAWRLCTNQTHRFASQSANPLRPTYDDLSFDDLKAVKFAGAVRFDLPKDETVILSVSGLPPQVDEVCAFLFGKLFFPEFGPRPRSDYWGEMLFRGASSLFNRFYASHLDWFDPNHTWSA